MKPIRFSFHAKLQMNLRGATKDDVIQTIRGSRWEPAKMGKYQAKHRFDFNKIALTNQKIYKYKTVEPIFGDDPDEIVVITVKVYYSNEEAER